MHKTTILSAIILSAIMYLPDIAFAETIILKSGQTIEGKIVERNDKYIGVKEETVIKELGPSYFAFDEIESIDGVKVNLRPEQVRKWKTYQDPRTGMITRVEDSPNDPANAWKKLFNTVFLVAIGIGVIWFLLSKMF